MKKGFWKMKRFVSSVMACAMLFTMIPVNVAVYAQALTSWLIQPTLVYENIYAFNDNGYALAEKNWTSYDVLDQNGNAVVSGVSDVRMTDNGFVVEQNSQIGVVDFYGNIITPFESIEDHIEIYCDNHYLNAEFVWNVDDYDDDSQYIYPIVQDTDEIKYYQNTTYFYDSNSQLEGVKGRYLCEYRYKNDEKYRYGIADCYGNLLTDTIFDSVYILSESTALVRIYGDKSYNKYLYNVTEKKLYKPDYDYIATYGRYFVVQTDGLYGLVDRNLNVILDCEYQEIDSSGVSAYGAWVKKDGKWGYITFEPTSATANPRVVEAMIPISYEYDTQTPTPQLKYPSLSDVNDTKSAVAAVKKLTASISDADKQSADVADLVTLYAEEALSRAAKTDTSDSEIVIDDSLIGAAVTELDNAQKEIESTIAAANIKMPRKINKKVTVVYTGQASELKIEKKYLSANVDSISVLTACDAQLEFAPKDTGEISFNKDGVKYEVNFNTGSSVALAVKGLGDNTYAAVVDENGNAVGGKYNPATDLVEAKLTQSGVFKVINNKKDFADIKGKAEKMQEAITVLASKGIISGTGAEQFSPDAAITRAEVAAIIMRTLSKLDPNENGNFADVQTTDWYCGAAGSSKKYGIINGYEDNTFRATVAIPKTQISAVAARVLKSEMGYTDVASADECLAVYDDVQTIADWAKNDVALATYTNLIVKRTDGKFGGDAEMTRGDAAVVLYNMFMKIW